MHHPCWVGGALADMGNLKPQDLTAEKIGSGLAKINRYNGGTPDTWPVACHSVVVSKLLPARYAAWGLLHDAHEFVLGDLTRPAVGFVSSMGAVAQTVVPNAIEKARFVLDRAISEAWGVTVVHAPVARMDDIVLDAEMFLFFARAPNRRSARDVQDLERAIALIQELPYGRSWQTCRDLWIQQAELLASLGQLRLPVGAPTKARMMRSV